MTLSNAGLATPYAVVEAALASSRTTGCIVLVEDKTEAEVRFANNSATTNGVRRSQRVTVVSLAEVPGGVAAGVAARTGAIDVEDLVRAAETAAAATPPARDASPLLAGATTPDFDAPAPQTDLSILEGVLAQLSGAFERAERADTTLAGFASHSLGTTYLGTSTGIRRRHVQPTGSFKMVGRSAGGARSAWVGVGTSDFHDVTVEAVEEELSRRLAWARRTVDLPAGRYEVVLPPAAVADLMTFLFRKTVGQDAEDGKTVFSKPGGGTRVGESLCTLPLDLRSDPAERTLECAPFLAVAASSAQASVFDNGMKLERTEWVKDGRLAHLQYPRAGARRTGVDFAGPIDNLVLELPGATGSVSDLVASTERGLLLTCLWYIREVDPATLLLTGLTRDGVYLIEDGKVIGAANNFRFNESPVDLLARATQAGATVRTLGRESGDYLNRTAMPPLRIMDFNMSSVSAAS